MSDVRAKKVAAFKAAAAAFTRRQDPATIHALMSEPLARRSARFFFSPEECRKRAAAIKRLFPGEKTSIRASVKDILAHRFDLLGSGKMEYGFPLRWHRDYRTAYEWPPDIDYRLAGRESFDILVSRWRDGEIKFPWDLSNMMWVPSLVAGHYLDGNRRCADLFIRDTMDWIRDNPPFFGVNWYCPMNIAMRAINILIGTCALYPVMDDTQISAIVRSLIDHGHAIAQNLEIEKHAKRNNHYLTNLAGLYFLGTFFYQSETGRRWFIFAREELEKEVCYQFYADGVTFEDSTSYHRLSTEMLLLCAILGAYNDKPFSKRYLSRCEKALGFTADIIQQNNTIPQFGDNDNGRMVQFFGFQSTATTDHRHILASGGEFFKNDRIKCHAAAAEPEAVWLTGSYTAPKSTTMKPYAFSYVKSGFYGFKSPDTTMVIRNGAISPYCTGGHAHEDQLSFTLHHNGADLVVDPGSYRYSSDMEERNLFRSVTYHNTIQIDNSPLHAYDQDTFEGLWRMDDCARAETRQWAGTATGCRFHGIIHSFEKKYGILVERKLSLNDTAGRLVITDILQRCRNVNNRQKAVNLFSRFHFAPDLIVKRLDATSLALLRHGMRVAEVKNNRTECEWAMRNAWYSPRYGEKVPSRMLVIRWSAEQPRLVTEIAYKFK